MKRLFLIEDGLTNKISYYHLALFLVLLPFDRFYSELALISLAVHTAIHYKTGDHHRIHIPTLLMLYAVFLLTVLSTLYTSDLKQAFSMWTRQLAIVLFPLIFFLIDLDLKRYLNRLLLFFALSCIFTIIYLYIDAFRIILYYKLPASAIVSPYFINHNFSSPIGGHATYLSMYAALSFVYLLTLIYKPFSRIKKCILAAGMFILLAGLVQLGSRSVLISVLLFTGVGFPALYLKQKHKMLFVGVASLLVVIVTTAAFNIKTLRHRFVDEFRSDISTGQNISNITDPRMERWKLAAVIIERSPLIGHGAGDEVRLLKNEYFDHKLYNSYLFGLNAHNQYLSFLIRTGIVGLLAYLFVLAWGFQRACRTGNIIFLGFLIMLSVVSLSENYLDVNKGIFFYAFFFSYFCCMRTSIVNRQS